MNNEEIENEDSGSEELFEHYRFTADPGQVVVRIDKFLIEIFDTEVTFSKSDLDLLTELYKLMEKNME